MFGCVILCAVGLVNDLRPLRGRHMLLGQLLAIGVVLLSDLTVPEIRLFRWEWELDFGGKVVTALMLLAAINAFRMFDGLDALVSCIGLIVTLTLAAMTYLRGQPAAAAAATALAGALLGFLRYNFPPATVLLGTSGSMVVGLIVGVLAVMGSIKGATAVTLAAPTALLTLPLFDGVMAVLRRRLAGRGLYTRDQDHLYHRLRRWGLSQRRTILLAAGLCVLTAAGALASQAFKNELYSILGAVAVVAILIVSRLFGHAELSLLGQHLKATASVLVLRPADDHPSPSIVLHGPVDWDRLWDGLVAASGRPLNLKQVSITVGGPVADGFQACWHVPGRLPLDPTVWRAEFPLTVNGERVGGLDVVGFADDRPVQQKVSALARLVREVEDHAADLADGGAATAPEGAGAAPARRHGNGATRGPHVIQATRVGTAAPSYAVNVSRLRICHLGKFYPPASGGIETHVRTLAQAQAALGADVRVICVNHAGPDGRDATWRRVGRTPTAAEWDGPVRILRVGRWASVARLDVCPRLALVLRRLMDDPPHVLHLHTPNPTMLLAVAWFCPALPLVITHHSDIIKQRLLHYPFSFFERLVYMRASTVLATSPAYASGSETLRRFMDKVQDLPLGLDLTPFLRPGRSALAFAERLRAAYPGPLWLTVGRLTYYKALHIALEALARAAGTLLVIGTGPLDEELQRRAEQLGVSGRVVWQGYASPDELVGAYHAATALWFPSNARSEGFGLVQVEAMASGCPVINAAVPASGVPWVCQHEATGLTVPVNDAGALAAAAVRLLGDPQLRGRLVSAARERAATEFDHVTMARRSLVIYERVLAGNSARIGLPDHARPAYLYR
jgi:rhamnosyl/mannosyltransferase